MAKSVVDLFQEASDLEEGERATLAGLLLESLEGEPDPDVEAAWVAEIERRLHQIDAGEVELIPWEDVKERLLARESDGKTGKARKSNITDNDSAKMMSSHGVIQGYDGVAAADAKHQVIVHAEAFGEAQ